MMSSFWKTKTPTVSVPAAVPVPVVVPAEAPVPVAVKPPPAPVVTVPAAVPVPAAVMVRVTAQVVVGVWAVLSTVPVSNDVTLCTDQWSVDVDLTNGSFVDFGHAFVLGDAADSG